MNSTSLYRRSGFLVIILWISAALSAQEYPMVMDEKYGGRGFFSAGMIQVSMEEVNTHLSEFGYPELSGNMYLYGGSGYGIANR